jgi:hypothetical protein
MLSVCSSSVRQGILTRDKVISRDPQNHVVSGATIMTASGWWQHFCCQVVCHFSEVTILYLECLLMATSSQGASAASLFLKRTFWEGSGIQRLEYLNGTEEGTTNTKERVEFCFVFI